MSFSDSHLFFDDVQLGQEWESLGRTVTETDIVNFAGLSGDFNPIHIDHEFCKNTVFRKPIAHGLLILSMGSGLGLMFPPMRTLAFVAIKDWRFLEPVYAGDTIRIRAKVLEKEERSRGKRGVITWNRQIVNQHGKAVEEGLIITLVEGRARRQIRSKESEVGSRRSEVGGQESGVRGQESEVGSRRSEVGGQESGIMNHEANGDNNKENPGGEAAVSP